MALVKCRECGSMVSNAAKSCVRCGAPTRRRLSGGAFLVVLIALGGAAILLAQVNAPSQNAKSTLVSEQSREERARDACFMAQQYVKMILKSPKTAEFGDCFGDSKVSLAGTGPIRYRVEGFVDSQNSFSAMIRSRFVAVVEQADAAQGTWRLVDIKM